MCDILPSRRTGYFVTEPVTHQALHNPCAQAMREAVAEEPATLFVVAAYHIGKERAFLGAAQQLGAKVRPRMHSP